MTLSYSLTKIQSQNQGRIRILIVDDQKSVRCKLKESLTAVNDIEIVGTVESGERAIALVGAVEPDLILMDIEMPEMNGIEVTQILIQQFPQVKILILTSHEKEEYIQKIIASGADGYILKQTCAADLVTAIRLVYKGYSHFGPGIFKKAQFSSLSSNPIAQSINPPLKQVNSTASTTSDRPNLTAKKNVRWISKFTNKPLLLFILSSIGVVSMMFIYGIFPIKLVNNQPEVTSKTTVNSQAKSVSTNTVTERRISALGRIEPNTKIIKVSVPASLSNDRVAALLVKRGDTIKAGQTIAILDSRLRLQNALVEAQAQVEIAQAKLKQVKAGATAGEIIAQETEISRLQQELASETSIQKSIIARRQAELEDAQVDYNRYLSLYQQNAISGVELDQRKLTLATAQTQIKQAKGTQNQTIARLGKEIQQAQANLDKVAQVRPTDIAVSQFELNKDVLAVKKAQDDLEEAYIRAPTEGRIFNIIARPGEVIGSDGLVEMAKTSQMEVVAEVYESDINQVREGETATIVSNSFPEKLKGKVSQIGLEVVQQKVTSGEPGENLDRKVIEVRIKLNLEDSKRVSNLTNLQVQVLI